MCYSIVQYKCSLSLVIFLNILRWSISEDSHIPLITNKAHINQLTLVKYIGISPVFNDFQIQNKARQYEPFVMLLNTVYCTCVVS